MKDEVNNLNAKAMLSDDWTSGILASVYDIQANLMDLKETSLELKAKLAMLAAYCESTTSKIHILCVNLDEFMDSLNKHSKGDDDQSMKLLK